MDINEFNALSDEQKAAFLSSIDSANKQILFRKYNNFPPQRR